MKEGRKLQNKKTAANPLLQQTFLRHDLPRTVSTTSVSTTVK